MNLEKKAVVEETTKTVVVKHDYKHLTIILLILMAGLLGINGITGWGWFLLVAVMIMS